MCRVFSFLLFFIVHLLCGLMSGLGAFLLSVVYFMLACSLYILYELEYFTCICIFYGNLFPTPATVQVRGEQYP